MKIVLLFIIILFSGCKSVPPNYSSSSSIPFQVLITTSQSNIEKPQRKIITSQNGLESIFAEINKTRKPGIPIPEVDFDKEVIAFVNLGQTATGGHSISVKNIDKSEGEVVIHIGGTSPEPADNVTMVITTPFTMVKLKKQFLPIVFEPKMKQ